MYDDACSILCGVSLVPERSTTEAPVRGALLSRAAARILGDACVKLRTVSLDGTELDVATVSGYVGGSPMRVTALSPHIGDDKASAIAHKPTTTARYRWWQPCRAIGRSGDRAIA
jgi:hypothetical protein